MVGRRLIVVLGMHRSGTSLLASVLHELGAYMGEELLSPDRHNAPGYWEHLRVVAAHDRILGTLDRDWGTVRASFPYPEAWWRDPAIEGPREELRELLRRELAEAERRERPFAVKDPRLCRLLPLWLDLLEGLDEAERPELVALFGVRGAGAVARSLKRRDSLPETLGRLSWVEHYAEALAGVGSEAAGAVLYDDWFTTPERAIAPVVRALGLDLSPAEALGRVRHLIRADQRHQVRDPETPETGLVADLEAGFESWCESDRRPDALDAAARRYFETRELFSAWVDLPGKQDFLEDIRARDLELGRLRQEIAELTRQRDHYKAEHERAQRAYLDEADRAEEYRAAHESAHAAYEAERARAEAYRRAHDAVHDRLAHEIEALGDHPVWRGANRLLGRGGEAEPLPDTALARLELLLQRTRSFRYLPILALRRLFWRRGK